MAETMNAVAGFSKRLNRFRNLLHGAVIEDCKDYPSDRQLQDKWAKAEATEDDLREFTCAALERAEAMEELAGTVVAWLEEHECPHCRAGLVGTHRDDACPFAHLGLAVYLNRAAPPADHHADTAAERGKDGA